MADDEYPYVIYWEWPEGGVSKEKIDEARDPQEAQYLVGEYWLAYGRKGRVWYEEK